MRTIWLAAAFVCLFMSGIETALEADFGSVPGVLHFEGREPVKVDFTIDKANR